MLASKPSPTPYNFSIKLCVDASEIINHDSIKYRQLIG